MTNDILVDYGEEYLLKNGIDGVTIDVALYDDSTDALSDTSDESDISTEPTNSNYARQSVSVSVSQNASGNFQFDNDNQITFDFTDVGSGDAAETSVDTAAIIVTFDSSQDADGSVDHLVSNPALGKTHQTGDVDFIEFDADQIGTALD